MLARRISPFEGGQGGCLYHSLKKNFTSLTIDFQPLNNSPQKNLKKSCQKICRIKKTPYLCTRK